MFTPLINVKNGKAFLLEEAKRTRAHTFTRVSKQTMIDANEALRQWYLNHIKRMPSKGKTL